MPLARCAIAALLGLLTLWPAAAEAASLSGWRVEASSAGWMAADGDRWVAWGVDPRTITAFDSVDGERRTWRFAQPCRPGGDPAEQATAGGRLLVTCGEGGSDTARQALLDLRTGWLTELPTEMREPFALPGIRWTSVGTRWVGGVVPCFNGPCGMWYDLAGRELVTGILTPARDLDSPKLPTLARCTATRRHGVQPRSAYNGSAMLVVRHAPGSGVWRLDRINCHRDVLLGRERHSPRSLWLASGLASWTTALPRAQVARSAGARRATLTIAAGTGRARVTWRLPALPVADCDDELAAGAWGTTTHTRTRAFFAQTIRQQQDGRCVVAAVRVLSRALPARLRAAAVSAVSGPAAADPRRPRTPAGS